MEQVSKNLPMKRNGFSVKILKMVVCTIRVVRMKEHLPFCREYSILCIE